MTKYKISRIQNPRSVIGQEMDECRRCIVTAEVKLI